MLPDQIELCMTKDMINALDKFFATETTTSIDRTTFLVCNLKDNRFKDDITISLVFLRDWPSIHISSYDSTIIEGKGVVFQFPPYWVSIPKELTMEYFKIIINNFYQTEIAKWLSKGCCCPCGKP